MTALSIKEFIKKYNSESKYDSKYINLGERSFCFYGHWFGRPTDISYKIINSVFDEDILTLKLTQNATLIIKNPNSVLESEKAIIIKKADEIIFEWLHYSTKVKNVIQIVRTNSGLTGQSNLSQDFTDLDLSKPAILWQWGDKNCC